MRPWPVVALLLLLLCLPVVAQTPQPISVTEALGFDYPNAEFAAAEVSRFEANYDNAAWVSLGIPPAVILVSTTPGSQTYKVVPPFTSGTHTVLFRACNGAGCGSASVPFAFVFVASSPSVAPGNLRAVPR